MGFGSYISTRYEANNNGDVQALRRSGSNVRQTAARELNSIGRSPPALSALLMPARNVCPRLLPFSWVQEALTQTELDCSRYRVYRLRPRNQTNKMADVTIANLEHFITCGGYWVECLQNQNYTSDNALARAQQRRCCKTRLYSWAKVALGKHNRQICNTCISFMNIRSAKCGPLSNVLCNAKPVENLQIKKEYNQTWQLLIIAMDTQNHTWEDVYRALYHIYHQDSDRCNYRLLLLLRGSKNTNS